MPSKQINVAIIGAGFISDYHINGIRAAGGGTITTLVGRRLERTARRAAEFGIPRHSTAYRDVLADPHVDAVVIATPDATHLPLSIEALQAGKPVLLQKPMARSSRECRDIIAVAEKSRASLTVSFMHRYFPEVRWLRDRIADNSFGRVHSVRLRNATPGADWADWFFNADDAAGGVVMQLGVHGIDLVQHLFGPITRVSALSSTMKPIRRLDDGRQVTLEFEDNVVAAYRLAAGCNASHEMSWTEVAGCDRFRLEVYFEKATVWLRTEEAAVLVNQTGANGSMGWRAVDIPPEPLGRAHHAHWLDVASGRASADDTAAAGLSTLIVAEHIYRSAREGKTLSIAA